LGDDESRSGLSLHLAELEIKAGSFDAALAYAEEGLSIQEGSYAEEAQGSLSYVIALARAYQGDVPLARELAERGLARCEAQGDVLFGTMHRVVLGFLELSLGNHDEALDWTLPVADRFRAGPIDPSAPHLACIPDAAEALVALDRLDEAEEVLDVWEAAGERFGRPRVRATAARGRALVAAARGDVDDAVGLAEASVDQLNELPLPFERARSLIVLGALYRRTRKKAAARAALEEAHEALDAMGARLWAERAAAELARVSGRSRSGGLTATEERVAELVAQGMSNKQVAEALFVSVRTVEANLTRIYAKLGIRSRTELASRRDR
jgi:DNA-binding CsgD family transcriptional regulator